MAGEEKGPLEGEELIEASEALPASEAEASGPTVEVVSREVISGEVEKLMQIDRRQRPVLAILFGGDRLSCCDEGVLMREQDKTVGFATIAPSGEDMSGQPTIVGLYVTSEHRGRV